METSDIICFVIVFFVGLSFVLDLLGAAGAALKKKEYKSMIGSFIEDMADRHSLWWFPVIIAILYTYGLLVLEKM